jgi:hypothetical protein
VGRYFFQAISSQRSWDDISSVPSLPAKDGKSDTTTSDHGEAEVATVHSGLQQGGKYPYEGDGARRSCHDFQDMYPSFFYPRFFRYFPVHRVFFFCNNPYLSRKRLTIRAEIATGAYRSASRRKIPNMQSMSKKDHRKACVILIKYLFLVCNLDKRLNYTHTYRSKNEMMRLFIIIPTLLTFLFSPATATNNCDSLLCELDKVLSDGPLYMEQKEQHINRLKMRLRQEVSADKQYELCYNIIEEYKSYMSDSALVYINKNLRRAAEHKQIVWEIRANLQYSFVLSSSGLFIESKNIMEHIPKKALSNELWVEYYKCMELLYVNIEIYQADKELTDKFQEKIRDYRDSVLWYLPGNSPERLFYQFIIVNSEGRHAEALEYLNAYMKTLYQGTHEYAKKCYNLSILYQDLHNTDLQIEYLILAVISDVKDAVKENRALLDLAIWLYEHNDIKRAFNYIQYALNDANFYNARFRYFEISKALPIITSAYQQLNAQQSDRMKIILGVFSLLFILLLALLIYLQKQMAALKQARRKLKKNNQDLEEMNDKLNSLNRKLTEANRIKEEYVGYFLDLCSEYIGYLENYRKMVSNKVAAKRFDELARTISSSEKGNEIKELYANFDKAFLSIYPGFVSSLNELLKEEERFEIRRGDLLNTELRIFALIRLGITDSSRIASFLRCSMQTVYNYRSKIKRSSLNDNTDIEEQIKKIETLNLHA